MPAYSPKPLSAAKAQLIRSLVKQKKERDQERAFVLEGEKPILELLASDAMALLALVIGETRLAQADAGVQQILRRKSVPIHTCRDSVFDSLSDVTSPSGILAVVRQPAWDQQEILSRSSLLGLYGETLQDPANVGTIVRTALGFGLDALWLSADSADVFNPKVVRATAGGVLKLPVLYIKDVANLTGQGCALLASVPAGKTSRPITDLTNLPERSVLAFGNESRGLSDATLRQATVRFHIPVSQAIESLNVAASAAIASFYFRALSKQKQPAEHR
ncbi:MAG: RNA methyltransferase [Nitrospirae bacterium]|nr:MAG: RNA methyltransferase [Nitrospirota bacterium]